MGSGRGGAGVSTSSSHVGTCSTVDSCGSSAGAGCCSCCRCAASVALKSSASGPSRMLARLRAIEPLLREVAVDVRGLAGRVVPQHRLPLHGPFRLSDCFSNYPFEDEIAEVLLENVDGF